MGGPAGLVCVGEPILSGLSSSPASAENAEVPNGSYTCLILLSPDKNEQLREEWDLVVEKCARDRDRSRVQDLLTLIQDPQHAMQTYVGLTTSQTSHFQPVRGTS